MMCFSDCSIAAFYHLLLLFTLCCVVSIVALGKSPAPNNNHKGFSRDEAEVLVQSPSVFPWLDPSLPISLRVSTLIGNMTISEKIGQIGTYPPSIDRLMIPAYGWWSESSHGVAW